MFQKHDAKHMASALYQHAMHISERQSTRHFSKNKLVPSWHLSSLYNRSKLLYFFIWLREFLVVNCILSICWKLYNFLLNVAIVNQIAFSVIPGYPSIKCLIKFIWDFHSSIYSILSLCEGTKFLRYTSRDGEQIIYKWQY